MSETGTDGEDQGGLCRRASPGGGRGGVPPEMDEPQEVSLIDETGKERRFWLHDAFDTDQQTYYLVEAADDPDEVLLLKEGAGSLQTVNQEEFDRIIALLEAEE